MESTAFSSHITSADEAAHTATTSPSDSLSLWMPLGIGCECRQANKDSLANAATTMLLSPMGAVVQDICGSQAESMCRDAPLYNSGGPAGGGGEAGGAIAARQQEVEEQRLKREREKQAAIRTHQKEQVKEFYLKQQRQKEELERRDQERLANLRALMEEQARRDKERVEFRAEMLQRRREEREEREAERQREEEEKQKRLEALRNQVAVVAEADPERLKADTEAWRSRHTNTSDFELQRPLYTLNTYTDTQIVSDPRIRIEQALRQAGLHNTMYAKEVLSSIPPPKPPRKDTKSGIKL
ncbi:hypothetical protein WMY93_002817 [Mugilogobius chulae]|uniref:Uncharacterized protein n=1 Tax=Mugilogobius chulae TaxID=88201 RepID=A0AAW0PUU6_9GOBI